jgi:hypothetical protein
MNTDNTSKWKKSFSDTNDSTLNEDKDFQTKHMMHKISSVKKKKKMKNYKNIPVLKSIHDVDNEEEQIEIPILKKSTEGFETANKDPVIEGVDRDMNDFTGLDDWNVQVHDGGITYYGIPDGPDFWDGLDAGDEGAQVKDPRQILIDALNAAYKAVNEFNRKQAKMIADALSKNPDTKAPTCTDADVTLLQKYISYFESIICAYFFSYNIIYVSMYIDEDGERIKIPRITSNFVKDYSTKSAADTLGMSLVAKSVVYFLTYALYFSDILQTLILDVFPEYFLMFLNAPSYMIAIFIALIFVIDNMVPFLIQFFTDVIMLNTTNSFVNMMYFFVIFMFIIECFGSFDVRTFTYSTNNLVWTLSNPITSLVLGIIQFIIAIMISVPVGAVLCMILFIFYSFSIFLYPITVFKFEKLFEVFGMFSKIDGYLKRSFQLDFDPNDENLDMMQKTKVIFTVLFDFANSYIYYIANIVMLSFSTDDYTKNISSKFLKTNLLLINGALLFMFVALCVNGFFAKLKVDRKASDEDIKIKEKEKAYYAAQYKARQDKNKANLGPNAMHPGAAASEMEKKMPIPASVDKLTNMIPGFTKFSKMAPPAAAAATMTGNIPAVPTKSMVNNPVAAVSSAIPTMENTASIPVAVANATAPSVQNITANPVAAVTSAVPPLPPAVTNNITK